MQDALLELDTQVARTKMEAAYRAIEIRQLELNATPESPELTELIDALHSLRALGLLLEANDAVEQR